MKKMHSLAIAGAVWSASAAFAQVSGGPVQPGDLAWGLNRSQPADTAWLIRGGTKVGNWAQAPFLQSMEFDNLGGKSHNARGNLLGLNFGTTAGGGKLHSLSTDGTDAQQLIYCFSTAPSDINCPGPGIETTRISGLGVSPNNTRLSCIAYDTGSLLVLNYQAGNGNGTGAAITGASAALFFAPNGATQGTAWLDNDTVLGYTRDPFGNPNNSTLQTADIDGGGNITFTIVANLPVPGPVGSGSFFLDVEYNPLISPYVYCMYSIFEDPAVGGAGTQNRLTIVNPSNWSIVKTLNYNVSMNTAREIALGPDHKLYMGQFGNQASNGPWVDTIDVTNVNTLVDNGSADYYQAVGISAQFNGMDVAVETSQAGCPFAIGDANCDGAVDFFDIDVFIDYLINGTEPCALCTVDALQDDVLDFFDIDPFIACVLAGGC